MQRDKKGRFVKKAQTGLQFPTIITLNNKTYKVKPGANQAFTSFQSKYNTFGDFLTSEDGKIWLEDNTFTSSFTPTPISINTTPQQQAKEQAQKLDVNKIMGGDSIPSWLTSDKIKYYIGKDGKNIDQFGNEINISDLLNQSHRYELDLSLNKDSTFNQENSSLNKTEKSAGMNITGKDNSQNKLEATPINKTKLADFLEYTRAGIGAGVNNKIAERALEAEKPLLQDVSESHRAIYGDYRAQVEGEKAAAKLRNMASNPLTSDGALQSQMMMEAQIKGQEYIDKGRAQDDAMIKQTREVAWQQEKENQQQRQAAVMQNRQAMLMTEKNKAQIRNMRDSANFSQVVSPLLSAKEQRWRNEGAEQEYYQDYYDDALVSSNVWKTYNINLTPEQQKLRDIYNTQGSTGLSTYIGDDATKLGNWNALQRIMQEEIIRRKAGLKGVQLNIASLNTNKPNYFDPSTSYFKKGGTVYKARLTKRTKDNDRGSKSIESSKKIATRFLEKAINSLYTYNDIELIAKPKRKKRKYQAGGGLPFVGFTPVFATSEKGAPKSVKEEKTAKGEDLTSKDVLSLLKDMDGLPSDMQVIMSTLKNFELQDQMDPLGLSSSSDIASKYIKLINQIKVAKFNRDEYNNAFNQLKGNGGLTEFAITSEGMLIGTNAEGDFKYFSPEDVIKGKPNEGGYELLTNSNLLHLRANSLDAAFNHKLTTVAQNGIGIETVNKLINDAVSKLGTSSNSEEGYTKTKQGELLQGLDDFYNAVKTSDGKFDGTINDLYKYKFLTKSQAEQAKKAIQYIYNTLPTNARALLKVKSDGSEMGALKLIETLISSKETKETQFDLDLVGGKSHKSTTASNKDNSELETSLPLNVLKNIGGVDSYLDIDRGDGIHMSIRGTQFNYIKTPNGEPILDTSISNMLHQSGLQSIVKDMRSIQFGDQKISPEALSFITYNNTGLTRANLPIKADGSVNLDLLEAYEQAERELDLSQDKSPDNIKAIYEKYGITSLLNADGSYNQSKFAPFMVTEGYTTDALSGLKNSDFVTEYKGDENVAVALMQRSLAVGSGKNTQTPDIDTSSWYNPADWFGWTDTIYKGVVYIPITNNVNTAVLGANQSLDYDEALIQEEKYQNFERMSNQRSTDASLLNI